MQKHSATLEHKHVYFDLSAYLLKKLLKNWKNPNVRWLNDHGEMKLLKARIEGEDQKS